MPEKDIQAPESQDTTQDNAQGGDTPTEKEQKPEVVEKAKYISLSKKLTEAQRQIDEFNRQQAEQQGNWEKIAKENEEKLTQLQSQVKQEKIQTALMREAQKLNPVNIDAVIRLVDQTSLEYTEEGEVSGVSEALQAIQEQVPQLFTVTPPQNVGRESGNPDKGASTRVYTQEQIDDPIFRKDNWDDIKKAYQEGRIQ